MPVPTAVPPSGSSARRGSVAAHPLDAVAHLRGVAGELLAEGDRGGVHQVGAAGLHDVRELRCLRLQATREQLERRDQVCCDRLHGGDVDRGGEHVVGRLRGVHVVVRVHRRARAGGTRGSRPPRWCSCSTRCPSRSGRRRSGTGRRGARRSPRRLRRRWPPPPPAASTPSSALASAAARLIWASAAMWGPASPRPEIGKFSTARWVWAAYRASLRHPHLAHRVVLDPETCHQLLPSSPPP